MTCSEFRASRFDGSDTTPQFLAHLRSCNDCMNYAAERDGDFLFKALGGDEMVPPGGLDSFVSDVMRQIEVRSTEQKLAPRKSAPLRFALATAAALGLTVLSYALVWQSLGTHPTDAPAPAARVLAAPESDLSLPVIEEYDSSSATIVEMPSNPNEDVKIVMIFDESLPADL